MDILRLEGISYLENNLKDIGVIISPDHESVYAIHSKESWVDIRLKIRQVPMNSFNLIDAISLIKTTPMKSGDTNYVFTINYN